MDLVHMIIVFVALVIAFAIAYYAVNALIENPQVKKFATVFLVVLAGIAAVIILLNIAGGTGLSLHR